MMKAAQTWPTNNLFRVASANGGTPRRSSLVEPEMGAILMVVTYVFGQKPLQMPPISHDQVVQEVPPTASNPTLCDAVLPRTSERGPNWLTTHCFHRRNHIQPELRIAIENEMSVR
jgi:hypothetical protein